MHIGRYFSAAGKKPRRLGRGGGQVVSLLAFYSDDPSSNELFNEYYSSFCKMCAQKEQK